MANISVLVCDAWQVSVRLSIFSYFTGVLLALLRKSLLKRYEHLIELKEPYYADSEEIIHILEFAESDENFSNDLRKIDRQVYQELGLLDEEHLQYYEDQAAKLREYIGLDNSILCKPKPDRSNGGKVIIREGVIITKR